MTLPRFSVRELLGFVAFLAVGTTALLYATPAWAIVLGAAAMSLLFVSVVAAVLSTSQRRAFWLGAAIFGWLYIAVANWTSQKGPMYPLPTTNLLRLAYEEWLPDVRTPPRQVTGTVNGRPTIYVTTESTTGPLFLYPFDSDDRYIGSVSPVYYPSPPDFRQVGQSLWTLLIAYLGGRLGRYFYLTRNRDNGRTES